ncbi:MAG: sensory histidine kinase AtoS [Methanoregula sp. PtaU1.Bin051]|nr:MAG: sensory histidine kinase AtoS [Methanoregula sp. PtaU1.Bin051]
MSDPLIKRLRNPPVSHAIVVLVSAVIAFTANIYCIIIGVTTVSPHLFYIPIILAAFFFPRRGIFTAVEISSVYFLIVAVFRGSDYGTIISAAAQCVVFIVIAAIMSYLSNRINDRETALRHAKEEWERTFDAVPDLIALIDTHHRIFRVNRAMAESLGLSPHEVIGKRCYEIVHRTHAPPAFCPHALLLKDGMEHSSEIHEDHLGGDFMVTSSPLRNANGRLIGSVHVARDITVRKLAEEALREKTEELDRFFSVNLDLLCIADTDGNFHHINAAWESTLGYNHEELMAYRLLDLVHPDDLQKTLDAVAGLAERKEVTSVVNRYRCRDDSYRWIEWRMYPYGNLIYAAARDITDRIQAELAFVQANKKLNILSSITRHDILNKITALYAYLDLTRDMCTNPAQRKHIDKQIGTVEALQRQIEFTRYYQDIGVKAPEWQDIATVFSKAVSQIPLEGVTVRVDGGGYQIYADPLIEKVFYNLVENSLRHGGRVTSIQLATQKTAAGLLIIYRDNGNGIPVESKENLFQRGYGSHTGFGLFLSREILAITDILITENGEPGKGARFEIIIPHGGYRKVDHGVRVS